MRNKFVAAAAAVAASLAVTSAQSAPSAAAVERAFHLHPGAIYVVTAPAGERLRVLYLHVVARRGGEYAVVVQMVGRNRLSVSTVERAFNLYPGATVPLVMATGRQVSVEYLRTEARGGGLYAIVVRA